MANNSLARKLSGMIAILMLFVIATPVLAQTDAWPGEQPAFIRAYNALRADNNELAAKLFGIYLENQPNDERGWYNYACILARLGQDSAAMKALEASAIAGFARPDWVVQDPDLENLRGDSMFTVLVERMRKTQTDQQSRKGGVRWLEQSRVGCYELFLPKDYDLSSNIALPVVYYLHGGSGTLKEGRKVANRLTKEGFAVILIEAPYRSLDGLGHDHQPTGTIPEGTQVGFKPILTAANELNAGWYRKVLNDAGTVARLDRKRVAFLGFSQGAFQVFYTLAMDPKPYAAAAIIGGRIPETVNKAESFSAFGKKDGKVLLLYGDADGVGDPDAVKAVLDEAGVKTEITIYPGVDHRVTDQMVDDFAVWVKKVFAK